MEGRGGERAGRAEVGEAGRGDMHGGVGRGRALTREKRGKRARGAWGGTGDELAGLEVGEAGLDNRAAV